ncbi:hypothetical protein SHELI_v1c07720 [Spiroplasma helicoides]|uniref:Uncharacterized protein n=1 Tax=Spiroplasma helicoides TaxID=216938 RepID=A0A1B3SLA5_9MOLU|nr:hypothetical protein [Spiroplasma helicoides]AOG60721.1 hypothetical protein SHELI_v1c07720 [Spiroplasma helicoides]
MTTEKYVFLGAAIGFLIILLILVIVKIMSYKNLGSKQYMTINESKRGGLAGIWAFTKQHFLSFMIIVCILMMIACFIMTFSK